MQYSDGGRLKANIKVRYKMYIVWLKSQSNIKSTQEILSNSHIESTNDIHINIL